MLWGTRFVLRGLLGLAQFMMCSGLLYYYTITTQSLKLDNVMIALLAHWCYSIIITVNTVISWKHYNTRVTVKKAQRPLAYANVRLPGSSPAHDVKPKVPHTAPVKQKEVKVTAHPKGNIGQLMKQIEQCKKDDEKRRQEREASSKETSVEPMTEVNEQFKNQTEVIENIDTTVLDALLDNETTELIPSLVKRPTKKKTTKSRKAMGNADIKDDTSGAEKSIGDQPRRKIPPGGAGYGISMGDILSARNRLKTTKNTHE